MMTIRSRSGRDGLDVGEAKGYGGGETRSLERDYGHFSRRKQGGGNQALTHLRSVARYPMQDRVRVVGGHLRSCDQHHNTHSIATSLGISGVGVLV
jgi:hypothetical protein